VALGDPAYAQVDKDRADGLALTNLRSAIRTVSGLRPLPYSRLEVDAIRELYPDQVSAFVGAEAPEEHAKQRARGARYLHFACHSLLDEDSPLNSGLVLTVP